jgi:ATP/maltotriose-dependent transcriptional regulator MalT
MIHSELPLIRTKLAPPRVGSAPVRREALLKRLEERRDRRLALVLGPAGCGKTMLLTQWRKSLFLQGAKVAWYNASADDNDDHVIAYLMEGLMQAGVAVDTDALQVYRRSGGRAWRPLISSLIDDLCDEDRDVYVIIDDLHNISSFKFLQMLDTWLSMAPERCHLVLGSRSRPPLQLGALRTADDVTEIQFDELRFSLDETRHFLQSQGLSGLSGAQEARLHEMSDGWAAGLQLLAYSLRKSKTPEQFFENQRNLTVSQAEALEDYLENTVSKHLTAAELGFLVRISACRRFNRELCELLTGDPAAGQLLARFEKENLFLIPIDTADAEPWYRFHRLFAAFLHRRLARLGEAEVRSVHNRACHWFAGKDLLIEAMRHATLAGDTDFAVALIDRTARRLVNGANFVELLKWCGALPRESLRGQLNVLLCVAWAQLSCSRVEEFELTMADVAAHPDSGSPSAAAEARLLRAYSLMRGDDTAGALRTLEPMMLDPAGLSPFQVLMVSNIASMCQVYGNRFEQARETARLRHQIDIRERADRPRPLIDVVGGFSYLVQGNIALARAALGAFIGDILNRRGLGFGFDAAGLFSGYLLEALYQSNELREARDFLDHHIDLIEAVGSADGLTAAYRVRARLQVLDGDHEGAAKTLSQLEEFGYRMKMDRIIAWTLQEQVTTALHRKQSAPVQDLLERLRHVGERHQGHADCAWSEIGMAVLLARAQAAFAADDAAAGIRSIEAAHESAQRNRRQLLTTQLGLMRAVLLLRAGQEAEAVGEARALLDIAAELGMKRLLNDLGPPALPLIGRLLRDEHAPARRALLESAQLELATGADPAVVGRGAAKATAPAGDVLSAREHEVLVLLSRALSIKSIGRTLDLTAGTVKWHLRNVYSKLDAVSREDALAKARNLRILQ